MNQTRIKGRTLIASSVSKPLLGGLVLLVTIGGTEMVGKSTPALASEGDDPPVNVGVFFKTNRERDDTQPLAEAYTGNRGAMHAGRCEVAFEPIQVLDQVAAKVPFYVPSEKREIVVVDHKDPEQFWKRLKSAVMQNASQSVVVFVHGYNYNFERTCRMAAEMQRSLDGKATVLMFSWPSEGRATDYVRDQADMEWSVPALARLLTQLKNRLGAEKIQVLAHSMGSRGVIFALQQLKADVDQRPLIGRLVFLAPDFDAQTFAELLPRLKPLSASITLYASSNDTPLRASEELNGHPRLGQAGDHLTVLEGMETIDVSPAGRYQMLGHEYFFYHPKVVADLVTHVSSGAAASERPGLHPKERDGVTYWEIMQ